MHTPPSQLTLHPPKRLGHLPLIADVLRSSRILDVIDEVCGVDQRMRVSHGECVAFVLLGVFAGEHGLWRLTERLDPYDLATVMGDSGFNIREFHDVRIGRMLDAIYHTGPDRLMSAIAVAMIRWADLDLETLQFDTSSLSFHGAYEDDLESPWSPEIDPVLDAQQVPERSPRRNDTPDGDGRESPLVVRGYAKNKRFDLKQVLFGMVVAGDGGVPLYGRVMDGNASDITAACAFMDHLRTQVGDPRTQCFVADSKGWAPRTLEVARCHGLRLLSRLPRSTGLAQRTVAGFDRTAATCRLRAYHPDRKRWSWVAYQGSDAIYTYHIDEALCDEAGKPLLASDGTPLTRKIVRELPVRLVVCYSSELYRQKAETLGAIAKRETIRAQRLVARWAKRTWPTRDDAEAALHRLSSEHRFLTCIISGSIVERKIPRTRTRRGRPRTGDIAPEPETRFAIELARRDADTAEQAERLRRSATYVLIRSRIDGWDCPDETMLDYYSRQSCCESGFAWLKSHAAINPMFVQSPRRIAALCFLYCIALMVHTVIQRNVRRHLKKHGLKLPYYRNKPSDNITARFFYELYRNVTTQTVTVGDRTEKRLHGMDQWTRLGLTALGASPSAYEPVLERPR
jgi:transposase